MRFYFLLMISLLIAVTGFSQQVLHPDQGFVVLDSLQPSDIEAEATIAPFRKAIESEMNQVIGTASQPFIVDKPNSPLSSLMTDMMITVVNERLMGAIPDSIGKGDLAVVNIKGIRTSLPQGSIFVRQIYEIMPFENELVVLGMTGLRVKQLFQFMASQGGDGLSGASFKISGVDAIDMKINEMPVDDSRIYRVVVSDYLANGGDRYTVLQQCQWRYNTGIRVRDAFIEYIRQECKSGRLLVPSPVVRIVKEDSL